MTSDFRRRTACAAAICLLGLSAEPVAVAPLGRYTAVERRHWAFQPRRAALPPSIRDAWIRTPIDNFVLEGLRKAELMPAPEADRATLIRRVTYDLHGLPPTVAEVDAFVKDPSPKAYESLVERLLASPRYGEQWARHWLDVIRFAESDGYEYDMHRPDAFRFRDYVIQSFNEDKPYDVFLKEQLAGDEIDPNNETLLVASGFNRLGPLRKNAGNQEVASSRTEVLTEMTNIVGAAFLGVTIGCARCHDHKFDAFRQSDYYRLQGYFAQTHAHDVLIATPEEQAKFKAMMDPLEAEMRRLRFAMRRASEEEKGKLQTQLEELDERIPPPLTAFYTVANKKDEMTPIHMLERGDYRNKGPRVGMRPIGVLLPDDTPELPLETEKPRLRLAEWVASPANPLTARVMANRVWGFHFGRGLVATPNDFGKMGLRPTHPELLDYLAGQFVAGGWTLKPLHRMLMNSATYRQASASPDEKAFAAKDPSNKLLWKWNRRRLEAEEIRDSMLFVSGRLNPKAGGPSVLPAIDPELIKDLKRPQYWMATKDIREHDRRTIYMIYKRNLILPFMQVFDSPDTLLSCARREQSTHAPQALELLNGELSNRLAKDFAALLSKHPKAVQVDLAWRMATGRAPNANERTLALSYLDDPDPVAANEFALSIFNTNAFLYVN
ncbi:MAG: DUF1549 domain-containing protein [Acidobacteria bacterium]|nr:DUF1549 domain-containing protein [Acidobacteriota bacterium]